ncbi:hypothetical protein V5799_008652 [Amblyomma americanum]|uniref:Uncharacterized protein n=1 Tax=Amblyomma americanum TaxID=6943 RepID=A0AAQ4FDT2_AMBAM
MGCGASKGRRQARSAALSYAINERLPPTPPPLQGARTSGCPRVSDASCEWRTWASSSLGSSPSASLQHMVFCTTAIATRLLGLCIYAVVYNVHDKVKAESSADMIQFTLHWEELSSHFVVPATLMTAALEAYFLCSLIRYQRNFTPRSSDQEEAAAAASGSSAEADHAAAAGGGSPAGASHGSDSSGSGDAGGK